MTKGKNINEGTVKKGGINPQPSTPRPANPPKGQNPPQHTDDSTSKK